ncbi:amphoterin-induced protein 3 [Clupea harengus]|uniref:Amphoterin-induced protein 3 n=1 Tax=Clupea harengus TaxID=7950 RepID=A0A6P3VH56_CLUHA|nr:amphoterin-induced protein 3 [Clupea harengus]
MGSMLCIVVISLLVQVSESICPAGCLCPSYIVSCGNLALEKLPLPIPATTWTLELSHNRLTWLGVGTFYGLPRLARLRLAHNLISQLSPGAFQNASALRHLDLSSNKLQVVGRHHFLELTGLEELLLFNNRIARVESNALMGLGRLKHLYLSFNHISDFPFFSIRKHTHPHLLTVDLSSNHMSRLPVEDIALWPASHQRGLFLFNNSLLCDCATYTMLRHWEQKGYESVTDFKDEYRCLLYGDPRAPVRFFRNARFFENCTVGRTLSLVALKANLVVYEGELVKMDCTSSGTGENVSFSWTSPHQEGITQLLQNGSLRLNQDGSLEIPYAKLDDSGVYQCTSLDRIQMLNESREVNVTVVTRQPSEEPFNTGYTTLLGCVVTLVVILMYLYLTPCRCSCCRPPAASPGGSNSREERCTLASIFRAPSSMATSEPMISRKAPSAVDRHVVFLEPLMEEQNGHLKATFTQEQLAQFQWETERLTPAAT